MLAPPNGKPFKKIAPPGILERKEILQHTHVKGLPKSSGTGNQGYLVIGFPPLPDKICLINIKIVGFPYNCKIVMADSELSCHIRLLLSFPVKLYSTPPCRFHGTIMNERGGTVNLQSLHPYNHISSYYYML